MTGTLNYPLILAVSWIIKFVHCQGEFVLEEVCPFSTFRAACPEGEVILMTSAEYGRMRVGSCIDADYSVGCSAPVLSQLHARCTGRTACSVPIPDAELTAVQPCRKDLMTYLEASYTCIKAITITRSTFCNLELQLEDHSGYLLVSNNASLSDSNSYETHLERECSINFSTQQGQTINVSVVDLTPTKRFEDISNNAGDDNCPIYALIKENDKLFSVYLCGNSQRKRHIFTSSGNAIDLQINFMQTPSNRSLLLHLEDIGCADLVEGSMKVERVNNSMLLTCESTAENWHLVCKGNKWIGGYGTCDIEAISRSKESSVSDTAVPIGAIAAIGLGILLGVMTGSLFLFLLYIFRQRVRVRRSVTVNARYLKDNMYKPVAGQDMNADQCYICTTEHNASIYKRSCLELSNAGASSERNMIGYYSRKAENLQSVGSNEPFTRHKSEDDIDKQTVGILSQDTPHVHLASDSNLPGMTIASPHHGAPSSCTCPDSASDTHHSLYAGDRHTHHPLPINDRHTIPNTELYPTFGK